MALPNDVRCNSTYEAIMSPMAATSTNRRNHETATEPIMSGSVGKGVLTDLATPPQISNEMFCNAIQQPIMATMVESISAPRILRKTRRSISAPNKMPSIMAVGNAIKKFQPR